MLKSYLISLLSLVAVPTLAITYSADLKCGRCIKGGYNFCFEGNDTQKFNYETQIQSTCCADSNCAQASDPAWTCSSSYSDPDYALTMCPFKMNKCGSIQKVEYGENDVNVSQTLTLSNLEAGDTCSFMIKSTCNSPGFRVASARKMNDSNVDISFIEYKKSFINATEKDKRNTSESKDSRKWKMPDDDRPPRNQSWEDMGQMNSTCKTKWNGNISMNLTDYVLRLGKNYAVKFKKEANNTLTVTICERKQYKPRRKRSNGTYTEKDDWSNTTRKRWEEKKTEYVKSQIDVDYMDTDGMDNWSDSTADTTSTDYYKNKGGWGSKWEKRNRTNSTDDGDKTDSTDDGSKTDSTDGTNTDTTKPDTIDPNATEPERGYGKPSKGKYSAELGGYKSFGTEGQGNSSVGIKDDNDTTCGDRIVLLTVTATQDTTDSSTTTPTVQSSHPFVRSTEGSSLSIEVGNYQFLSDLSYDEAAGATAEEFAVGLKSNWIIASLASLLMISLLG